MKMLSKRPEERYQTPAEVVAALAHWTQTPIDPPGDEEMPHLCPAVQAVGSTITSRTLTLSAINLGHRAGRPSSAATAKPPDAERHEPAAARAGSDTRFVWVAVLGALAAAACGFLLW